MAQVILKIKQGLAKRGVTSFVSFQKSWKNFDMDGNKTCTVDELLWGLKDYNIDLTKSEAEELVKSLDKDGNGVLNFDEFLSGM